MSEKDSLQEFFASKLIEEHPRLAARQLETESLAEIKNFLTSLTVEQARLLLEVLHPMVASECLQNLSKDWVLEVFAELSRERSAAILRRFPERRRQAMLSHLPKKVARSIAVFLEYPMNTAGTLMTPDFIAAEKNLSVGEFKNLIRHYRRALPQYLYLTDSDGRLEGTITYPTVIQEKDGVLLDELPHFHIPAINAEATIAEIQGHPGWRDYSELPVVDEEIKLIGIFPWTSLHDLVASQKIFQINPTQVVLELGEVTWVGMMAAFGELLNILFKPRSAAGRR